MNFTNVPRSNEVRYVLGQAFMARPASVTEPRGAERSGAARLPGAHFHRVNERLLLLISTFRFHKVNECILRALHVLLQLID